MSKLTIERIAALMVQKHVPRAGSKAHPAGVVVQGDALATANLADPSYAPYCLIRVSCGRLVRVDDGFECTSCGNKTNWDLTHFDGNQHVRFTNT